MDASYKKNEMDIFKIAIQLEQLVKREKPRGAGVWLEQLEDIQQQIKTRKFRMAVVGEFNRGKSSFINVLLGRRILPEDVLATTATINRITYGDRPKAYLIFRDESRASEEIPVEELNAYITKLTAESAGMAGQIQEAVLEYPTMLCYDDVDLIDTPGMNDMEDMNEVTVNQLENIDLAVVAINAQYPYSETENRFVVKLLESSKICQIIFVVTHFDRIRPRDRKKLMEFLRSRIPENVGKDLQSRYPPEDGIFRKYHSIFDDIHIYGVSSRDAMEALERNDMELFESSGFLRLRNELPREILSSRTVSMLENYLVRLTGIIDEYLAAGQNSREKERRLLLRSQLDHAAQNMISALEHNANQASQSLSMEDCKGEMVEGLLRSLGLITEMSMENIQNAMFPTMHDLYVRFNQRLADRFLQVMLDFGGEPLRRPIGRMVEVICPSMRDFPELQKELPPEEAWLGLLPEEEIKNLEADLRRIQQDKRVLRLFWVGSPIRAVLGTREHQSVLPELRKIVDATVEHSETEAREILRKEMTRLQTAVGRQLEQLFSRVDSWVTSTGKEEHRSGPVSELEELRRACDSVCRQIRG